MVIHRQTGTKQQLTTAFVHLLETEGFNKMTVKDLTAVADINRSTFYNNYLDKYDLEANIEEELMAPIDKYLQECHDEHELMDEGVDKIMHYLVHYRRLIHAMMIGDLELRLSQILQDKLTYILDQIIGEDRSLLPFVYSEQLFVSTVSAVIMTWIKRDMQDSITEVIKIFSTIREQPMCEIFKSEK